MENRKIEIRCKRHNCNRLLMNYYATGKDISLDMQGFELKCEKCKRVFRMKKYTENMMIQKAEDGVLKI